MDLILRVAAHCGVQYSGTKGKNIGKYIAFLSIGLLLSSVISTKRMF